ncbi:MAG: hypothetical protein QXD52_02885, partial [Candidatus Bathyarchaeia archaeon]
LSTMGNLIVPKPSAETLQSSLPNFLYFNKIHRVTKCYVSNFTLIYLTPSVLFTQIKAIES